MKKKILSVALMGAMVAMATVVVVVSCSDKESDADKGKAAAQAFCKCITPYAAVLADASSTEAQLTAAGIAIEACSAALPEESAMSEEYKNAAEAEIANCPAMAALSGK
jgi:hypothetical protein